MFQPTVYSGGKYNEAKLYSGWIMSPSSSMEKEAWWFALVSIARHYLH